MAIVRGDRIAESRSLNARSIEAQEFYGALIAKAPDDFGRFRREPSHVALALYPRRELTLALLRRTARMLDILEADLGGDGSPLFDSWVCDGVRFAQLRKWKAHGNRYHRTPEPPGSDHVHSLACYPTAIARARDWISKQEAHRLSIEMKELRERKRSGTRIETERGGDSPSTPSPSSPSSVVERRDDDAPPPNPALALIPDRATLEAEYLRLVPEVAALRGCDPTEVMGEAGAWSGRRQLNPAAMKLERLMNVVLDLRRMKEGKPAHAPPKNPRAEAREAAALAGIEGGKTPITSRILEGMRRDRPELGRGDSATRSEPARPGPNPRDEGTPGGDPPRGDGTSHG